MNIDNLNNCQREAVLYNSGPLLILAGAGSGKTKVLTTRIAYLIKQGINPDSILAITFTNFFTKETVSSLSKIVKFLLNKANS